jgi:hypothetical protein
MSFIAQFALGRKYFIGFRALELSPLICGVSIPIDVERKDITTSGIAGTWRCGNLIIWDGRGIVFRVEAIRLTHDHSHRAY